MTEMSDSEFISYCMAHSETEVAGFSNKHAARILRLAGNEPGAGMWEERPDGIYHIPARLMHPVCKKALAILKENKQ